MQIKSIAKIERVNNVLKENMAIKPLKKDTHTHTHTHTQRSVNTRNFC